LGVVTAERRERLLNSRGGLPSVLWVTLVAVSILTVGYPLFFGANRALAHAAIVSTLTIEVSLFVFVIYVLASPFHGDVYVAPEGMELFLRQFPSAAAIGTPTP
jgi:hypothetical protein